MSTELTKNETSLEKKAGVGPVFSPRADIYERDDGFALVVDLPGVTDKSLEIDLEGGKLTVYGEVRLDDLAGYELAYSEFKAGAYRRTFALSDEIDLERITASLKDGVLTMVLPRRESARPRKIQVRVK